MASRVEPGTGEVHLSAFQILGRAVALWWQSPLEWILLNVLWLFCQVLIITGPPATALLAVTAKRAAEGEEWDLRAVVGQFGQVFGAAWEWGLLNALVAGLIVANFLLYQPASGMAWGILRACWAAIGLALFALDLFYWPFWLYQEDRSPWTTYRNSLLLLARDPLRGLLLTVLCLLFCAASVLLTLPFAALLASWLALAGVLAVQSEVAPKRAGQ